jgi:hypothetical protein
MTTVTAASGFTLRVAQSSRRSMQACDVPGSAPLSVTAGNRTECQAYHDDVCKVALVVQ